MPGGARSTSRARATTAPALEAEIAARGLGDRVVAARPRQPRTTKARAVRARVGEPHRLLGRGLVPDGDGGRDLRDAERGAARSAGCRSRSSTARPACWPTTRRGWPPRCGGSSPTPSCARGWATRRARGRAAFTWERTARRTSRCSSDAPARRAPRAARRRCARSETAEGRRAWPRRRWPTTRSRWSSRSCSRGCWAPTDYGSLAALVSTFLILAVPGSALQVAVAREIGARAPRHGARLAATLDALAATARCSRPWP